MCKGHQGTNVSLFSSTHNQQIQLSLALGRCQGLDFFLKNLWLNNHWVTACVCASFSRGCLQLEVADWKRFNTIPSTNRCVASAQVRFFHLPWCSWDCCSYFLRSNKAGSDNHVLLKANRLENILSILQKKFLENRLHNEFTEPTCVYASFSTGWGTVACQWPLQPCCRLSREFANSSRFIQASSWS